MKAGRTLVTRSVIKCWASAPFMKRPMLALWIAAVIPLSGCNPVGALGAWEGPFLLVALSPTPPTDQLSSVRLPYTLRPHFTDEVANYQWTQMSRPRGDRWDA